jgi:hypothetical protein
MARIVSNVPTYRPNETQDIREALIEAGRQDLADGIVMRGIRNLEAKVDLMQLEVNGIKNAQRDALSETGVVQVIKKNFDAQAVKVGGKVVWALLGGGGALLLAFIAWVGTMAWRGATH